MDTFYIYVLYSVIHDQIYIGQTNDLAARLKRHNAGRVKSTNRYIPWKLIYSETFKTRSAAMNREQELKSHFGRDWIRRNLIHK
ncbi:MAG: GIY-YIG nuclease family protein [Candidatus Marinimicrobia bacterium]|nr:GIY-YIG nuclease family protein [Candidatus Neomarinimicrobiota bacterium]